MQPSNNSLAPQIVTLYSEMLSVALDNPEEFITSLKEAVQSAISLSLVFLVVEPENTAASFQNQIELLMHDRLPAGDEMLSNIQTGWVENTEGKDLLEEVIQKRMGDIIKMVSDRHPDYVAMHQHCIQFEGKPRMALCLFRAELPDGTNGPFTEEELQRIGDLEPHLINCIRVHIRLTQSRRTTFDFFAAHCLELATEHGLTLSEFRILRRMIEGATNIQLGKEFGISAATVKTHISHILQKTGCRNRTDLIGKYFSSKATMKI